MSERLARDRRSREPCEQCGTEGPAYRANGAPRREQTKGANESAGEGVALTVATIAERSRPIDSEVTKRIPENERREYPSYPSR